MQLVQGQPDAYIKTLSPMQKTIKQTKNTKNSGLTDITTNNSVFIFYKSKLPQVKV